MKHHSPKIFFSVVLPLVSLSAPACGQQTGATMQFEAVTVEPTSQERLQAVAAAAGFAEWARPAERYVAPAVSRSLLSAPATASEGVRSCSAVAIRGEPWGRCRWSWQGLGEGRKPTADSWLDLEITLAPDARAAQEYLLSAMVDNMLPTEALAAMVAGAERPAELGTVALLTRSRDGSESDLRFSRANVAFHVRGRGSLGGEVLALARRLDAKVASQSPLTLEQLVARRPTVDLARAAEAEALPFDLELPRGRALLGVQASVDGQPAPAEGGRVLLARRQGSARVEVQAITSELLVGAVRVEVSLGE